MPRAASGAALVEGLPFAAAEVARRLLVWYARAGRELPWRGSRDPYRVWLSEIMLQQTTVVAVIPYFERFLERYPDVAALAGAPLDEVISLWAGLGYYARARNLSAAARRIVKEYGGVFPATLEGLMALPGVGRSTAGAILSIAFDQPAPILDGNVRRVLCRLLAVSDDPRASATERRLWQWAQVLTPADRPHDYAQAIMDLGATLCVPRHPACAACPLAALCQARLRGLQEQIPRSRQRQPTPVVSQVALVLESSQGLLVRQRPYDAMLGGLWEFPAREVPAGKEPEQAAQALLAELGMCAELRAAGRVRHGYSHFRLDLHLYRGVVTPPPQLGETGGGRWLERFRLAELPLHGAHKKALELIC